MIEFKKDAYESLDVALEFLGDRYMAKSGYTAEVTPVEGEPFTAVIKGPAPGEAHDDFNAIVIDDALASYLAEVYRADENGQAIGDPFVIAFRKIAVL